MSEAVLEDQPPFKYIAAKGELGGVFRIWYGSGEEIGRASCRERVYACV